MGFSNVKLSTSGCGCCAPPCTWSLTVRVAACLGFKYNEDYRISDGTLTFRGPNGEVIVKGPPLDVNVSAQLPGFIRTSPFYVIPDPAPGTWTVTFESPRYFSRTLNVTVEQCRSQTLTIRTMTQKLVLALPSNTFLADCAACADGAGYTISGPDLASSASGTYTCPTNVNDPIPTVELVLKDEDPIWPIPLRVDITPPTSWACLAPTSADFSVACEGAHAFSWTTPTGWDGITAGARMRRSDAENCVCCGNASKYVLPKILNYSDDFGGCELTWNGDEWVGQFTVTHDNFSRQTYPNPYDPTCCGNTLFAGDGVWKVELFCINGTWQDFGDDAPFHIRKTLISQPEGAGMCHCSQMTSYFLKPICPQGLPIQTQDIAIEPGCYAERSFFLLHSAPDGTVFGTSSYSVVYNHVATSVSTGMTSCFTLFETPVPLPPTEHWNADPGSVVSSFTITGAI